MVAQQLVFEWGRDIALSFANFHARGNEESIAVLKRLGAGDLGEVCVYLWGARGGGKRHLVAATLAAARETGRHAEWLAADGAIVAARPRALYALHSIESLPETAQGRLFTLFNDCRDQGAQLLLTGDVPPARLPVRDDLRTRIGSGLALEVKPLADADKPAVLGAYAREQGFALPDEVIAFLLTRGRRDLGSLLAMLRALDRHSLATHRPVTVPMVRLLLQPDLPLGGEPGAMAG